MLYNILKNVIYFFLILTFLTYLTKASYVTPYMLALKWHIELDSNIEYSIDLRYVYVTTCSLASFLIGSLAQPAVATAEVKVLYSTSCLQERWPNKQQHDI